MTATFTITPRDYLAFCYYQRWQWTGIRKLAIATLIYTLLGAATFTLFFLNATSWRFPPRNMNGFATYLIGVVLGVALFTILLDIIITEIRIRTKAKLEQICVSILPDGFHVRYQKGEHLVKWTGIHKIAQNNTHFFFYFNEMAAFVVPKHAFESITMLDQFISLAHQYHTAAQAHTI